jgi:predicted metal-dependent hydrolase
MEPYSVVYSNRKTIAIYILFPGTIEVRAPYGYSCDRIQDFITKKEKWINAKLILVRNRYEKQEALRPLSTLEIKEYAVKLEEKLIKLVAAHSKTLNVAPSKVVIRNQKTKWGSCSSKKTLSFNWRLALVPDDVLVYIVIHELCHLVHMNHSNQFWRLVEKKCPTYKEHEQWLQNEGLHLLAY